MYKVTINRNTGEGDSGGATNILSNEATEAFKNRFGGNLIDPNSDDNDYKGDDNGDAGDDKGEGDKGREEGDSKNKKDGKEGNNGEGSGGDDGSGDSNSSTPLSYLVNKLGINLEEDEDFKDLDLEDDSIEAIEKFYGKREEKVKLNAVQEFIEEVPEVKDLIEHLTKGGSVKTWKQEQEAKELNIVFEKDDIDGKAAFMVEIYKNKGIPEKRAKLLVEALKDDNELDTEVDKEVETIKTSEQKKAAADKQREQQEFLENQARNKEVIEKVSGIVKQGKLVNNYVIPDTDKKAFNEFIFSEAISKKYETLSYEQRLMLDYIIFKDFKIKALETKIVDNSGVNKPRVRLSGGDGGSGSGGNKDNSITLADLKRMSQPK